MSKQAIANPHIGPHRAYSGHVCPKRLCFQCAHAEFVAAIRDARKQKVAR